jgi:Trk K+ transport system NAD-binding subunit/Kef-type K+ transport system membrane component KefB
MEEFKTIITFIAAFGIIAIAANQISKVFEKVKLPLITGFLLTGIIAGPFILKMIPSEGTMKLNFINELSLAFIAFAAGSELYLKEIRSQFKSIIWNTVGQLVFTFTIGAFGVYYLADYIPFMKEMTVGGKIAVSILAGTIFIASSPSSAIAVINELRAKGPFTKTAIGVTVVKDIWVIILFTICFGVSKSLISNEDFKISSILFLILELASSITIGWLLNKVIVAFFKLKVNQTIKTILLISVGYGVYLLAHFVGDFTNDLIGHEFYIEPLLICIFASFFITNYSTVRPEFQKVLHETGPVIYIAFFTLTGASLSIDVLLTVYGIAFVLFGIRLLGTMTGSFIGGALAGDSWKSIKIGWMPFITQAGVGLGLATLIAVQFPGWGSEFSTLMIAVIVINQLVGPPIFKYAIHAAKESHERAKLHEFDGLRDAIIFGFESQSMALARQLQSKGWMAKIATSRNADTLQLSIPEDLEVIHIDNRDLATLKMLEAEKAEAIVLLLSDKENLELCELIYEHIGTKEVIVRLHERHYFDKFHALGALIVDPSTAMVGLMDHLVRSPNATSLLLGNDNNQDTIDLEVLDQDLSGMALRDLRFPSDIIILSIMRKDQMIISHGYTRLRLGDVVTIVGSKESLEKMTLLFEQA